MSGDSPQRTKMFEERRHLDGIHARKMRAIPGYFRRSYHERGSPQRMRIFTTEARRSQRFFMFSLCPLWLSGLFWKEE